MLHALLALVLIAPVAQASALPARCPPAHQLEGALEFRGDRWPLRLSVRTDGDSLVAAIDIPELMMVGRPLPAECARDSLVLKLPFGFGRLAMGRDGTGWRGWALRASDTLRLAFSPGTPPPYRVDTVRFAGPAGSLAGALYLPGGLSHAPAIVMIHGSGPVGRGSLYYRSWADFYARRGIAALIYDKRGVGESQGDFRADSAFEGLAADVLAAVGYLRGRSEIDAKRIGIGGHSQAGWIAFRAAARDSAVGFLALMAVPGVSVAEQEIQRVRAGMRERGFDPAIVNAAVAHTRLLFGVAVSGLGWDALAASSKRVGAEPWADWVHRPAAPESLRWWRTHATVDPAGDLRRLRIPVFAAYSAADPVVPAAYNAGVLRVLIDSAPPATIVTVRRGDHLIEVAGRDELGRWRLPRIHPEVLRRLEAFLRENHLAHDSVP